MGKEEEEKEEGLETPMMAPKMAVSSATVDFQRKKLAETQAAEKAVKARCAEWFDRVKSDQAKGCCTKDSTRQWKRA